MSIDILQEKIRKTKSPVILDLDVKPEQIPPHIRMQQGSLPKAYGRFCTELMEALRGTIPAVRFSFSACALMGTEGLVTLSRLTSFAKNSGFYILLDIPEALSALRAGVSAQTVLDEGFPWDYNGLIISSYIGTDAIKPFAKGVKEKDKELFVITRTGNRSAVEIQDLMTGGRLVHLAQADMINRYADDTSSRCGYAPVGCIGPATSASILASLRSKYKNMFILVDGYDYPNANAKNCAAAFDRFGHGCAVMVGTTVTAAWTDDESDGTEYIADAVAAADRTKKNLLRYVTVL